jgi:hypothetical protein
MIAVSKLTTRLLKQNDELQTFKALKAIANALELLLF